jgi:cytoskeleton protein RodZ
MMLGLALVVLAYAGWYHLSGEGRLPAEAVQPVPARLARLVAPKPLAPPVTAKPAPASPTPSGPTSSGNPASGSVTAGNAPAGNAPAGNMTAANAAANRTVGAASGTPPAAAATPAGSSPPAAKGRSLAAAASATGTVPPGSAAAAVPTAAEDAALAAAPALAVRATADAWIQVRDADGTVVFSHLLHAGDSWPVPPGPALAMTTGNAGGTELVVNGRPGPPLGAPGVVLHAVKLSPPG